MLHYHCNTIKKPVKCGRTFYTKVCLLLDNDTKASFMDKAKGYFFAFLGLCAALTGYIVGWSRNPDLRANLLGVAGVAAIYVGVDGYSSDIAKMVLGTFLLFAAWRNAR